MVLNISMVLTCTVHPEVSCVQFHISRTFDRLMCFSALPCLLLLFWRWMAAAAQWTRILEVSTKKALKSRACTLDFR